MPPKRRLKPLGSESLKQFVLSTKDVNNNDECDGESENRENKAPNPVKPNLKFHSKWLSEHKWLRYQDDKSIMYCHLCRSLGFSNAMAVGTDNFKTTTLSRHIGSTDHQRSLYAPKGSEDLTVAIDKIDSKEVKGITVLMKVVFWMAKEEIPLSKYSSLINLLEHLNTPDVKSAQVGKIDYQSYYSACELLEAISTVIDNRVTNLIQQSPVVTIMCDESTDIVVHHKLCISARIVDPMTLAPKTLFLTDLRITSAKSQDIFLAIKDHLASRKLKISVVTGLGTDGASVMTGRKKGLTGLFLRENPHLVNTHCSAHKLALCTEQAAQGIDGMKYFQDTMESIYYYFKKSPERCDRVEAVQKILKDPQLKYREVHQVRWLSFLNALDAVYRTLDSLIVFFSSATDSKAAGLKKRISEDFFIKMTYAMMDILQPVMRLNLFFQRKDVDIGSVQINVENCLSDLQSIKDQVPDGTPFQQELLNEHMDQDDYTFKGHQMKKSKYSYDTAKSNFISGVIDNINKRFPDKQIMTSMCVLGLRPITFLNEEDLASWGNNSIETLIDHFGCDQSHTYKDDDNETHTSSTKAVIVADETRKEWKILKTLVKTQGYPRKSTHELWSLIKQYHSEDFPNLLKLAQLALAHPVHTADCERAFSAQNAITTPLRNRLSSEHIDSLMRICLEGGYFEAFDFRPAVQSWKTARSRKLKL